MVSSFESSRYQCMFLFAVVSDHKVWVASKEKGMGR